MSSWLDVIHAELNALDDSAIISPDTPVQSFDKEVGTITDMTIKKLHTLFSKYQKAYTDTAREAEEMLKKNPDVRVAEHASVHLRNLQRKAHLYHTLYMLSVEQEYQQASEPNMAVRRGWRVVVPKAQTGIVEIIDTLIRDIDDFFKRLL